MAQPGTARFSLRYMQKPRAAPMRTCAQNPEGRPRTSPLHAVRAKPRPWVRAVVEVSPAIAHGMGSAGHSRDLGSPQGGGNSSWGSQGLGEGSAVSSHRSVASTFSTL